MKAFFPLALLSAITLSTHAVQAQSTTSFGIKAGLTQAVLDGTINQDTEYKAGFHAGVFLRWRPSAHFALQPELTYSQQGSKNTFPLQYVDLKSKTKLTYLNVPVLAKIYLGNVFNIQVGPQFGVRLSAREAGQISYTSSSSGSSYQTADVETTKDYKSDVGVSGGLGIDLKNGFVAAVRLNYGLTDIDNNSQTKAARKYFEDMGGLHNRAFEFSVGYAFQ
ncbi:porin family protein [Hymenobacter cavernae]|uniref:Outer membrane protein beta-barrel domain-containing protein n=1 Tax=Hymenobacter cavernae TaxID=2044852 RepID=A0ABQ1TW91_9BACT|nr:porin family protein [Hymenobacter cavernae]GGF05094.1 hypothetical protein GCM10011383_15270 [Hymenobacter cavernae]